MAGKLNPRLERFEQGVVFRGGRVMPLSFAGIATVVLVLAVLALGYSFIPNRKPAEPQAVTPPAPVSVTLADIQAFQSGNRPAPVIAEDGSVVESTRTSSATADPNALAIATELHAVRGLLEAAGLAWEDEYQTVCTARFFGSCYDTERRLERRGYGDRIQSVLAIYDEDGGSYEYESESLVEEPVVAPSVSDVVQVPGADASYAVNTSNHQAKIGALKEIQALLKDPNAGKASTLVTAWATLRQQKEATQRSDYEARVAEANAAYMTALAEYETAVAKKQELRGTALSGVGLALGAFMAFGLILAVFAIERNTRALNAQVRPDAEKEKIQVPAIAR